MPAERRTAVGGTVAAFMAAFMAAFPDMVVRLDSVVRTNGGAPG